jgi:hypothetical protein
MKTYKKIIFGLCLMIGLSVGSLLSFTHKAAALSKSDFKQPPATYNLVGTSSISANLGGGVVVSFDAGNPIASKLVFTPSDTSFSGGQFCSGSQITMPNQTPPGSTAQINVKWINTGSNGSCNSNPPFVGPQSYSGTINLKAAGVPPPSNTGSGSTCDSNFVSSFSWIVCPLLGFTDNIIGAAYGQVEKQLCFNTGANSSTGGIVCKGPDSLVDGVKSSWSIFKNIASALLVIVMLAMVFSQAIGGGPFDPYTVRKMLPKLVAAVVLMQLSWLLLKFAIDLSNDIGSAIGALMMAPFGGPANMQLGKLIGNGVHVATGDAVGQTAFDVFATLAAVGAFVYAIPALPLLALYVIAGVFIAFFVLILRKLLIIMLVILAPIALVCWILPGTERYWKLWSENFLKLLAMFPLIMAMLAAGRIFAYITSTSGNGASMFNPHLAVAHVGPLPVPYFGSATGFADLAIIIGAFFAPYFLLPKTFNWGGQMLGAAGKAVENITNKGTEPGKKFLKEREESYRAERRRKSQERFSSGQGFNWKRPQSAWQRPLDLARAGKIDPTLGLPGSRRRQTAMDSYVAAGEESYQKEIEAARARIVRKGQEIRARGGNWDRYFQRVADGGGDYVDESNGEKIEVGKTSDLERMAARTQMATLGAQTNWRYLESYYEKMQDKNNGMSNHERAEARKFFDDNVQKIQPKLAHIYNGVGAAADSKPEVIGGMHGVEVEAILGNLAKKVNNQQLSPGERGEAQASLLTFLRNFQEAASNPNIRVDNGALRAVKGFLDARPAAEGGGGDFLAEINTKRTDGRQDRKLPVLVDSSKVSLGPEIRGELDSLKATLADRIDSVTGTYSSAAQAQMPGDGEIIVPHAGQQPPGGAGWGSGGEVPPDTSGEPPLGTPR